MKHLSHRTIAIIVALLSTLSLALAVISLPHQAYAVDGTDGTSGTNSTSQGSDGDSAPIAGPVPNIIVTNFTYGGDSVAAGASRRPRRTILMRTGMIGPKARMIRPIPT